MNAMLAAFFTGVAQVALVALNIRQIAAKSRLWKIGAVGFGISALWVLNVRAAASGLGPGVSYALGAGVGSMLAMRFKVGDGATRKGKARKR